MSAAGPGAGFGRTAAEPLRLRAVRLRLDPVLRREWRTAVTFLAPGTALFVGLVALPTAYTVLLSFQHLESLEARPAGWGCRTTGRC